MARLTLAIDLNRCMNCKACNAACKEQNDVGIGYFWNWVDRKQSDRLEEDGGAPSHDFDYLPMQCQPRVRHRVPHGRLGQDGQRHHPDRP